MTYDTNVIKNDELFDLTKKANKYKNRDCFLLFQNFFLRPYGDKLFIIYGLPKTGKTTIMLQKISELPKEQVVYIKIKGSDNMNLLYKDLDKLNAEGYKYIFIDDITLMEDFVSNAALLLDIYECMRMKIIISGNDSLCFAVTKGAELYDKCFLVHTTSISYKEYSRLFNDGSIENYIEHGGKLESADTPYQNSLFYDPRSMKNYIDKAIGTNILHACEKSEQHDYFIYFMDEYKNGNLNKVINDFMWKFIYYYVITAIKTYYDFSNAFLEEKEIIENLNYNFQMVAANKEGLVNYKQYSFILKYLQKLDLLVYYREYHEDFSDEEQYIFRYPAMINVMSKEYIHDVLLDKYFDTAFIEEERRIVDNIYKAVKMSTYVDTIFLEMDNSTKYNEKIFRYNYYDLIEPYFVRYYYGDNVYCLYEIRYDDNMINKETSALFNKEKLLYLNMMYGKRMGKYVIYLGESKTVDEIKYINVEEYILKHL